MFRRLLGFLKDRRVLAIVGIIALSILVWFGGPYVRFGENNYAPLASETARLIFVIVLLLGWGINNMREQAKRNKQNQELIDGIEQSQQDDAVAEIPGSPGSEEVALLRERFTGAMAALKKIKFQGKQGKRVVYELPWYIIIGPPGSGKTTALVNSGLEFPLADSVGKAALKGIGGTRNCDWWFTNDAVLIDTAGRYTTQDSHRVADSAAWQGFLDLLKKFRPRRPINGAIVAISLSDILTQTEEERSRHARTIRSRIDELMEQLGVRFPIYVMLTKGDLVSGFSEFFEDLGRADRDQVWGVTMPDSPDVGKPVDVEWFAGEYDGLVDRLNDRVLYRIHQERDINRRAAIEAFPQQMEVLKPLLFNFLKQTFAPSRYHFQPYVRGVYFSSGTQFGTPIDRMMGVMTSSLGLASQVTQGAHDQGKSYFINRLFKEVVFPEAELVGTNRRIEQLMIWLRRGGYVGITAAFVACATVWAMSVNSNKNLLHEVARNVEQFSEERKRPSAQRSDVLAVLPPLNALRTASQVYDSQEHPWLVNVGMYDPAVDDKAKQAYRRELQLLLLPRIQQYLEQYIRRLLSDSQRKGELYDVFRYYFMFQEVSHLDEEKQKLISWFEQQWDETLHGQATRKVQLVSHLTELLNIELSPSKLNQALVKRTRQALLRVPASQRIYSRLRNHPVYSRNVELETLFGDIANAGFDVKGAKGKMPLLYTKAGYDELDFSESSPAIAAILNDQWVLGEDARSDFRKDDLKGISKEVEALYLRDYSAYWGRTLSTIKVARFENLQQGVDVLSSFADPVYSPLVNVLRTTSKNTTLSLETLADDVDVSKSGNSRLQRLASLSKGKFEGNEVDKKFKTLNKLVKATKNSRAPVDKIIKSIQDAHDYLNEISLHSDTNLAAFEAAKGRFGNGGADAIKQLRALAVRAPKPVNDWLYSLADESWRVILASAKGHVNSVWRNQVYSKYEQALAGRYPLNRRATDEMALYDFAEFFKTGGTLDVFTREYLKPFVDTRRKWQSYTVDRRGFYFSPQALSSFKQAAKIRRIFFGDNPEAPGFDFKIRPLGMDESIARFSLEVGNQRLTYSHGPKFWQTLNWPDAEDNNYVRMSFEDIGGGSSFRDYDGPWAWFRLMESASSKAANSTNTYNIQFEQSNQQARFQIKARSVDNPFGSDILGSFNLRETL